MVGRIREILFDEGVDVDGIAVEAATKDYVDGEVAGVQGDADSKIAGMGTVSADRIVVTNGTDGKSLKQTSISVDSSNNVSGINIIRAASVVGKTPSSQLNIPAGGNSDRTTGTNGDIRYNTDSNSYEGYQNGAWKSLGGGGLIPENIDKTRATALESGKHYLYDGSGMTADVTLTLPAIAAELVVEITVYNIPVGYKLIIEGSGSEKIFYNDTDNDNVEFRVTEGEQWAKFTSNSTKWLVNDGVGGLGGYVSGPLTVTGALTYPVTSLTDAQATSLGLKQYLHGTTYNGGNAPTVTLSSGGGALSSVPRSVFVPYQCQDGSWRLKFNITVILSSATRTSVVLNVNGMVAKNVTGYNQAIYSFNGQDIVHTSGYTSGNTGNLTMNHASGTTVQYFVSGDIELESKPTWGY